MSHYGGDSRGGDHSSRRDGGGGYGGGGGGSSYGGGGSSYGNGGGGGGYGGGGGGGSYGNGGGGGPGGFQNSNLGAGLGRVDFSNKQLVDFEKDFYIEHPDVVKRSDADADAWRASKQMVVVGQGVPKPCLTFDEASMPEYVLNEVVKCGFDKPTPIQSQGWPMALKGRNMVGISATGSGKTLAFLLPAMIHINAQYYMHGTLGPQVESVEFPFQDEQQQTFLLAQQALLSSFPPPMRVLQRRTLQGFLLILYASDLLAARLAALKACD